MRIIAKKTLREFWEAHHTAANSLNEWYATAKKQDWANPNDVKATFGNASIIANNRVIFNIKGNDYRLVTEISYAYRTIFIIWIGTHAEYDKIDANTIEYDD